MNKFYIRKALDYTAGSFFNKLLLILFIPIFTHFMVPEEYAVYTNLMIFFSFTGLIYFLGMQQAIISFYHSEKTNEYKFSMISSVYITLILVGLILSLFIIFFKKELSLLITRTTEYDYLFIWLAVILFFNSIYSITLSFLNIMERSKNYVILSAVQNTIVLFLVIISTLGKTFRLDHYFKFFAFATIIAAIISIVNMLSILSKISISKTKRKIFSMKIVASLFKFGIVMIPGTFALIILRASDRYMLTYLSANSLYDVGIYAVGYRIGMIMQFLVSIVSLVYYPYAMRIADQPGAKESYRSIFKYFIISGSILGFLIIFFSPEIFQIFINRSYSEAIKVVFFGVISNFLLGAFNIINISFYLKKKAGNIALAVGIGAILNIILNYVLIPKYGMYGAGFSSIIAYLFIVIFNFSIARRIYNIGYKFIYLIIALAVLFIVAYINYLIPVNILISIIKLGASAILLFIAVYKFYRTEKFKEIAKIFVNKT